MRSNVHIERMNETIQETLNIFKDIVQKKLENYQMKK